MELKDRITKKVNENKMEEDSPFPRKNLLIEVTNKCNNKCLFCYNDCMRREKKFIDKDICQKALREAYDLGMREVGFYVVGEPLLDKRLKDFIKYAKDLGYSYVYITTNGLLANLERVKELVDNGLDSIKYSINASNKIDYKMIHRTDGFDIVMKNLKEVYKWKKNNNIKLKVFVSYISINNTRNEKEIDELFKNICDEYIVMPAINQGGLIPTINDISTKKDEDVNGHFKLPCPYPFNSVVVTVEGYLTACCMDFENLLAYADLNKKSLKESWNNRIIKSFRKKQLAGKVNHTICHNCIYNDKSIPKPLDKNLCKLEDFENLFNKDLNKEMIKWKL